MLIVPFHPRNTIPTISIGISRTDCIKSLHWSWQLTLLFRSSCDYIVAVLPCCHSLHVHLLGFWASHKQPSTNGKLALSVWHIKAAKARVLSGTATKPKGKVKNRIYFLLTWRTPKRAFCVLVNALESGGKCWMPVISRLHSALPERSNEGTRGCEQIKELVIPANADDNFFRSVSTLCKRFRMMEIAVKYHGNAWIIWGRWWRGGEEKYWSPEQALEAWESFHVNYVDRIHDWHNITSLFLFIHVKFGRSFSAVAALIQLRWLTFRLFQVDFSCCHIQ